MSGTAASPYRVALTGWFSFLDGEITAGDLLALEAVREALDRAGVTYETFWSRGFRPAGPALDDLPVPAPYSHLVFVCGPLHGGQVVALHRIFAGSVRIAAGVSVIDPESPAVTGFHRVLARDAPGGGPVAADLSLAAPEAPVPPVVAVVLTAGQGEYGERRRHAEVSEAVAARLRDTGAALLPLDTRLSTTGWQLPSRPEQFEAMLSRTDLVVTNRLHGLVVALRRGVPALAVDPVAGGAKLSAQARALGWPALLGPGEVAGPAFDRWWAWCLGEGRDLARTFRRHPPPATTTAMTAALLEALRRPPSGAGRRAPG
jgi:hypothetical protein